MLCLSSLCILYTLDKLTRGSAFIIVYWLLFLTIFHMQLYLIYSGFDHSTLVYTLNFTYYTTLLLRWSTLIDPLHSSILWYSLFTIIFWFYSVPPHFLHLPSLCLDRIWLFPSDHLCHILSSTSVSEIFNYAHSTLFLSTIHCNIGSFWLSPLCLLLPGRSNLI